MLQVSRINFIAGGEVGRRTTVMGSPFEDELTGGEYKLKGRETYVRAECIDMYGRKAWDEPDIPEMSRGGAELRKPTPLFQKRLARRHASAAQGRLPNPPFISSKREARRKIRRASRCA